MRVNAPLLLLLTLPLAAVAAPPPPGSSAIGPGQETADLTAYIAAHENDLTQSAAVAAAMQRLSHLEEEQKHLDAAALIWRKARGWFERHHFLRNGTIEAQVAAEATRKLLTVQALAAADLRVRTSPQATPELAIAERTRELDEFMEQFLGKRPTAGGASAVRQGGLIGELDAVRSFGALPETRAAAAAIGDLTERATLYLAKLPIPEGLSPSQQTAQQSAVRDAIIELEGRAFAAIEPAWLQGPDVKVAAAMALRKHLTRLNQRKYPQLEDAVQDMVAVTPEQQEASRLVELAQKAEKAQLRVLYLQKAVKLDPQNPRYLELLQKAKAEIGTSPAP